MLEHGIKVNFYPFIDTEVAVKYFIWILISKFYFQASVGWRFVAVGFQST